MKPGRWPRRPECWQAVGDGFCDAPLDWDAGRERFVCARGHVPPGRHQPSFDVDAAVRLSQDGRAARRFNRRGRRA